MIRIPARMATRRSLTHVGACDKPESIREQIAEAALARLCGSPELAGHAITAEFREGTLTLHGRTPTYFLKQRAGLLVRDIDGVRSVDNRIKVLPFPSTHGPDDNDRAAREDTGHRTE